VAKKVNLIGVDVGSNELVVSMKLYDNSVVHGTFDNTRTGHKKLLKFITKNKCEATVCMEATGIYHFDLAVMLAKSDETTVMIVNPKAMKHFGTAMMQRAKTDKIDSLIILEYLLRMKFVKWDCPSDNVLQIQSLSRRRFQLTKQLGQEKNRLTANKFLGNADKIIKKSINQNIKHLQQSIDEIQTHLSSLIKSVPELKQKYDLLNSNRPLKCFSIN